MLHPSIQSSLDILVTRLNNQTSSPAPSPKTPPNILALLVGTTDGVGLLRSFGRGHSPPMTAGTSSAQSSSPGDATSTSTPGAPHHLSEETLADLEGLWATLPSDSGAGHQLRPLGMGGIMTVTACYDGDTTLVHDVRLSPLVITFVAGPSCNLGAVRAVLPELRRALEPVRRALLEESSSASTAPEGGRGDGVGGVVAASGAAVPVRR